MTNLGRRLTFVASSILMTACGQQPLAKVPSNVKNAVHVCFGLGGETGGSSTPASQTPMEVSHPAPSSTSRHANLLDDVVGVGRVYDRNPNHPLVDREINLSGDSTLTSSHFITSTDPEERAFEESHEFIYETTNPMFRETSLFVNATKMLDWFVDLGFDTLGEQIGIGVNSVIGGNANNALYLPSANAGEMPTIRVGNGDGVVLQNLSLDADVVSHSLGHHILYRKLKSVTGESLIIHEALADSFVMLRNDDPCLAASICPSGSTTCWEQSQCLRTADNDLTFDDPRLPGAANLKGQVISGMFWDLRNSGVIDVGELSRLVFGAVEFLEEDSGVVDLIDALISSDDKNFGGTHKDLIREAAVNRHLI
jgi:hypothetical protein